ncbi:hypothetical protein ACIRS3_26655 [Streptomyces virginiae]|uniref:hypothetical protein n=1 Tax=Streptomyces virginiae TaxID=1961 RepID=UPI0037F5ECF9
MPVGDGLVPVDRAGRHDGSLAVLVQLRADPGTTKGQVEEMSSDLALRYSERATGIEPA